MTPVSRAKKEVLLDGVGRGRAEGRRGARFFIRRRFTVTTAVLSASAFERWVFVGDVPIGAAPGMLATGATVRLVVVFW